MLKRAAEESLRSNALFCGLIAVDLSEPLEPDAKQNELYTACPLRIKKQF